MALNLKLIPMQVSEQTKQCLLKLLDKFVAVCEAYGLRYYLAGGSVLGAVRHKGFIPWDDDIDVHMHRADYEKLQNLPDEVWGEDIRLASWRKTTNYTYDFLKLELTNTTVIERLHPDYVGGVFLDVFPLDFISDEKEQIATFEKKMLAIENKYIRCTIVNDNECSSIWELLSLKIERAFYNHQSWMDKWENLAMSFGTGLNKVCHSHSYFYYKGGMNIEWFGDGVYLEFEGREVVVPSLYDVYLKHLFNDYMKLPPKESRVGHQFLYVNYNERIAIENAKSIFKALHKQYAYHFSLKRELKYLLRKLRILK